MHFDNFSGLSENDGASPIQIDMDSPGRYFQMLPRVYTTQFHSEDLRFFFGEHEKHPAETILRSGLDPAPGFFASVDPRPPTCGDHSGFQVSDGTWFPFQSVQVLAGENENVWK